MPKDYEAIKARMRKQHPGMPLREVKRRAAKITNAARRKQGRPPARFHRARSRRKSLMNG